MGHLIRAAAGHLWRASGNGHLVNECPEVSDPCTDCDDPTASTATITGDWSLTLTFSFMPSAGDCDCIWRFTNDVIWGPACANLEISYDAVDDEWCARAFLCGDDFAGYTYRTATDCTCDSDRGVLSDGDVSCNATSGELEGSFTLPLVGGGGSISVTLP